MKHFLRIFVVFALSVLDGFSVYALKPDDISLKLKHLSDDGAATFVITLPNEWKLAKAPEIVSKYKSSEFKYRENFEKISPNEYKIFCRLNKNQKDVLKFDFFVCKDLCSIVSKDFFFSPKVSGSIFIIMLIFGFLGGLLLNVMPCVLPVIFLKIKNTNSKKTIINSILGNYLSFLLLAIILSILKASGEVIGWGIHFQNVYFLKFTVIFFFVILLISFGKLHFYWSLNLKKSQISNKFIRDIIYSIITTMIAIPCTAPLLGTAATFAIQESTLNLFLIFSMIATGFSLPYFLLLFFRISLEKFSKKTIFNKIINYGVLTTFTWLCWILSKSISPAEIMLICFIFSGAFLLFKKNYNKFALLLLSSVIFINIPPKNTEKSDSLTKISKLVEHNNIVILNITADWCLSCKYNQLKFKTDRMQTKIKENNIKFVEIDITKKDDQVMNFIHEHSRAGIPFTIIYGPKNKSGIVISEIPSISEIINTIDLVK